MGKTAIILGASGLTGNILLKKLLADKRYDQIKIFARKSIGETSSKILEKEGDLLNLYDFKKDFNGDEVYCCIGTTSKKTPDRFLYKKIDYGIPVEAARLSKENNIHTFIVISSMGADPKSSIFYNRTKGEMEQTVLKEKISHTYILRPSIIVGKRNEFRFAEQMGIKIMRFLQIFFIGKLKKYKVIEAEKIAQSMIYLANSNEDQQIIESDKIQEIGK